MKVQAQVNLHNRFDVEVRDAVTGELKQEAKAFNMVLDAMWTRLCGGSSYFDYIQFGTGTGSLAPTRTGLFTYLNYKAAVNDTLVKAIPNSSWKRKIVLNPEEFVGAVLTEVGISYSSGSTLVTHAMLEDAEGNPISITKTATDIITIYATVFVTFGPDTDDLRLINMPAGNTLVNYLIGGSSAPTGTFSLGMGGGACNVFAAGLESAALGATSSATWTADTVNKKRTTGLMRFGTTVANGHAQEVGFANVFRMRLPASGVFTGQNYTGVPIGTGDGVTRAFDLPSQNVRQNSIAMKLNGTTNANLVKTPFTKEINFKKTNQASMPSNCLCVTLTPDGLIMGLGLTAAPYVTTYDWIGSAWVKRPDPVDMPTANVYGVALSTDGLVMAVGYLASPYVITYDWTGSAWVKRATPATIPTGNVRGVALSPNGLIMALGHAASPYVTTYDWIGSAWVKRLNPVDMPPGQVNGVALSTDGLVMAVASDAPPYVMTYDWTGGAWVKRTNPANLPTGQGYCVALTPNGLVMAIGHVNSPYVTAYDWTGGVWVKRANPTTVPTGNTNGVTLSPDGLIMAVAHNSSPYLDVYDWTASAWARRTNPATLPAGHGNGICLSLDMTTLAFVEYNSALSVYDMKPRKTKITFDTAPAAGVAITSDYTVDGVHKTDQYVIDVGFSIQFGEPT